MRFVMLTVRSLSRSTEVQCTIDYTRYQPNKVWSGLKHLETLEHGESSDPWSEL